MATSDLALSDSLAIGVSMERGYPVHSQSVVAIGQMSITGNVIPPSWFQCIKLPNGRPNLPAIIILSDFLYWFRPTRLRDEETGHPLPSRQKFKADKLHRTYSTLAEQYGFGKDQVRDACHFLQEMGLITIELRTVEANGRMLPNATFFDIIPDAISRITHCIDKTGNSNHPAVEQGIPCRGTGDMPAARPTHIHETSTGTSTNKEGKPLPPPSAKVPETKIVTETVLSCWQDTFGEALPLYRQEEFTSAGITDLLIFRRVLEVWKTNRYSTRNIAGIISRYREEVAKMQSATLRGGNDQSVRYPKPDVPAGLSPGQVKRWMEDWNRNVRPLTSSAV